MELLPLLNLHPENQPTNAASVCAYQDAQPYGYIPHRSIWLIFRLLHRLMHNPDSIIKLHAIFLKPCPHTSTTGQLIRLIPPVGTSIIEPEILSSIPKFFGECTLNPIGLIQ